MSSVFHRPQRSARKVTDCAAIFVHAGAGYHSVQNEAVHLQACNDAATAAMALLRNGAKAVDAVEIAIKVLEDREITNAGYGSNLAIDGVVEGDAVIVDHYGRSGGVGAVAQIKNPIQLARHVLDLSNRELTLRRVPPNLLVGQGATDFGFDQGMAVVPHDALISPAARERWNRWKADLRSAERKASREASNSISARQPSLGTLPPYEPRPRDERLPQEPTSVRNSMWNEGEPVSPPASVAGFRSSSVGGASNRSRTSSRGSQPPSSAIPTPNSDAGDIPGRARIPLTADSLAANAVLASPRNSAGAQDAARDLSDRDSSEGARSKEDSGDIDDRDIGFEIPLWGDGHRDSHREVRMTDEDSGGSSSMPPLPSVTPSPTETPSERVEGEDMVTDTVGAIAIDSEGNIACGASSGGIGMKFRGRVGPAALVGVGAAVCPANPEDKSRMSTACVTSGTGEHMATTLAANVCAERLYNSVKAKRAGGLESCADDEAVKSMIEQDFMNHPSVRHSHSAGAIGVLAVKKMSHGVYVYFAHNTDSFAIASMHTDENRPSCTMSRSHGNSMVATGGRVIRYKRKW